MGLKLTIQTNRTLGGVGAVFSVLGVVSTVSSVFLYGYPNSTVVNLPLALVSSFVGLLSFVGFILFLVAMYGFSRDYNEHRIFNYLLYGFLGTIIAAIIAGVIAVVVVLLNITSIIPSLNPSTTTPSQASSSMLTFISPFLAVFSFVGIIWVIANFLAFRLLGKKAAVPLFGTAASILLAGAIVNVAVGIVFAMLLYWGSIGYNTFLLAAVPGGLVQDVAWVLLALAFFRIKVTPEQTIASYKCSSIGSANEILPKLRNTKPARRRFLHSMRAEAKLIFFHCLSFELSWHQLNSITQRCPWHNLAVLNYIIKDCVLVFSAFLFEQPPITLLHNVILIR